MSAQGPRDAAMRPACIDVEHEPDPQDFHPRVIDFMAAQRPQVRVRPVPD